MYRFFQHMMRDRHVLIGAAALAAGIGIASPAPAQDAAAPKVSVMAAVTKPVRQEETFIGRGEAIDKADIMARVNGYLEEVLIKDGAEVKQGDLLFRIERSAYEAALESARAEQAKAEASLKLAGLDLVRKEELFGRGAVPEAERDAARANKLVAEAQVRAAKAAVQKAALDLSYTEVLAPFSGRAGRLAVSTGDVVGPNGKALVNIVREAPIYVSFALNEKQFVSILEEINKDGGAIRSAGIMPEVFAVLPNGKDLPERGRIAFADNRIDPATGTVTVRAQFDNGHRLILDGAFLTVGLQAQTPVDRVVISQAAIQRDQQGPFVLVVGSDGTVAQRYIVTGDTIGTGIVVLDGLADGETVVVEGLQRIRPGAKVDPVLASQAGE